MKLARHSSPLLLAVALAPAFFQSSYSCERGDTTLLQLEFEVDGVNQLVGFNINNRSYALTTSSFAATLRTETRDPLAVATYQWFVDETSIEAGSLGDGVRNALLTVPEGESQLRIAVRAPEGALDYYVIDVNNEATAEPPAQTRVFSLACTNSYWYEIFPIGEEVVYLQAELTVDPTSITRLGPFTADLSGSFPLTEGLLDVAQLLPGGVQRAEMKDAEITVLVRAGATDPTGGPADLVSLSMAPIPTTCAWAVDGLGASVACDPADDFPDGFNPACGPDDYCGTFVDAPTETDCGACAALDTPPSTEKADQCTTNGFCITGDAVIPLVGQVASYAAAASGTVLVGLDDENTGAVDLGIEYVLPEASTDPANPNYDFQNGILADVVGAQGTTPFAVSMNCTMAVPTEINPGQFVPYRTPDSELIAFPIEECTATTCPGVWEAPIVNVDPFPTGAPALAVDGNGTVTAVWSGVANGAEYAIWSKRRPAGGSWSTPEVVWSEPGTTTGLVKGVIGVEADDAGNVTVAWGRQASFSGPWTVFASRYVPGTGWGGAETIGNDANDVGTPILEAGPSGEVMVVWNEHEGLGVISPWWNLFVPGSGWSGPLPLDPVRGGSVVSLGFDDAGNAIAVWGDFDAKWSSRYEPAVGWGTAEQVTPSNASLEVFSEQLAVAGSGDALLTWLEGSPGDYVRMSRGYTAGVGWDATAENSGAYEIFWQLEAEDDGSFVAIGSNSAGAGQQLARWDYSPGVGWSSPDALPLGLPTGNLNIGVTVDGNSNATAVVSYVAIGGGEQILAARHSPTDGWGALETLWVCPTCSIYIVAPSVVSDANQSVTAGWAEDGGTGTRVWTANFLVP